MKYKNNYENNESNINPTNNTALEDLSKKLNAINYSALNKSISSIVESINRINYSALNSTLISTIERLNQINYNAINNSIVSMMENINYSLLFNNSIQSIIDKVNSVINDSFNNYLESTIDKIAVLNNSLLYTSMESINKKIIDILNQENNFSTLLSNFNTLSTSIDLDSLDIADISEEETIAINTSSSEIIEKVMTGTLEYNDVKNNRSLTYSLILLKFLIATIVAYFLGKGLDYFFETHHDTKIITDSNIITQYSDNLKIITANKLNVRENPNTTSKVIYQLEHFEVVKVIDSKPYWFKIQFIDSINNTTLIGWISKKYTLDYSDILDIYTDYFSE